MTEAMQDLLADAKKNRYSNIAPGISEDDVSSVWDNMSALIEKQMANQKGVVIPQLGTFTFTQKKLDIGNNKYTLLQRPVFQVSEKFAQTHALHFTKYHVPGSIPVVSLNFAALSFESPFDRDTVETCIKEILGATSRAVGARKNVELTFGGIGRLSIRDSRVKMRFYKEFITQMDGTGKILDSMKNRPGTIDSVMSQNSLRPPTGNTILLPRKGQKSVLDPLLEQTVELPSVIDENIQTTEIPGQENDVIDPAAAIVTERSADICTPPLEDTGGDATDEVVVDYDDPATEQAIANILGNSGEPGICNEAPYKGVLKISHNTPVDGGPCADDVDDDLQDDIIENDLKSHDYKVQMSRMPVSMAHATGVSLTDDLLPNRPTSPKMARPATTSKLRVSSSLVDHSALKLSPPLKPPTPPRLVPLDRSYSMDVRGGADPLRHSYSHPLQDTDCGHPVSAGQELCYLCHQRARRNIPMPFTEERKWRQEEEDKLLQQYQTMKDTEEVMTEQDRLLGKRHDLQKIAAFNLGVAEATCHKKTARDTEFHRSYVFHRRALTPPSIYKQDEYFRELGKQVDQRENYKQKKKTDKQFLERLEQVQLAEDLAAQREQYLRDKTNQQDLYKKALDAQIAIRDILRNPDGILCTPKPRLLPRIYSNSQFVGLLSVPSTKVIMPFTDMKEERTNEQYNKKLKFKPLPLPACVSDAEIFGKNDMSNVKMDDRRRRARDLFRDQQELVAAQRRAAILRHVAEQKEEEDVLKHNKRELIDDSAQRYQRRHDLRKNLEADWSMAAETKHGRDMEERITALSPGSLLHEQCDKYKRCGQCKRRVNNCGETNIWSESRYISGARLMV